MQYCYQFQSVYDVSRRLRLFCAAYLLIRMHVDEIGRTPHSHKQTNFHRVFEDLNNSPYDRVVLGYIGQQWASLCAACGCYWGLLMNGMCSCRIFSCIMQSGRLGWRRLECAFISSRHVNSVVVEWAMRVLARKSWSSLPPPRAASGEAQATHAQPSSHLTPDILWTPSSILCCSAVRYHTSSLLFSSFRNYPV